MSAHIICVSSNGGLPIFSRRKGNAENLPFSTIGSLNGVHMFGKPQNIELKSTHTADYTVAWKEYNDSVVLIGLSSGCTLDVLERLLDTVFNAIVLIVGIDEVRSQKNIERLKRELKLCYPIVDRLIDSLDCGESTNKHSSDLVGMTETILCSENHLLQIVLDSFMECVDSMFICLLIHGKVAVATESWWTLHSDEIKLLSVLATAENTTASKDIPVFLPYKSPNVAFRFIATTLLPEVQICCLCGPSPSLTEIEHSAIQCFQTSMEILSVAVHCHPRNFPISCVLDAGVLGLLLVNITIGKYMMSKNPQQNTTKKIASSSHRLDILRTFFYQSVRSFLMTEEERKCIRSTETENEKKNDKKSEANEKSCNGKETYWSSEYHKCHALRVNDNILCVLYSSTVPMPAMRLIAQKTLKTLLSDKQICW